jgi:hypothetical protein
MRPGVFYLGGKMSDALHYRTDEEIEDVATASKAARIRLKNSFTPGT